MSDENTPKGRVIGKHSPKIERDERVYSLQKIESFFKPYTNSRGIEILEDGDWKMKEYSTHRTSELGIKIALTIIAMMVSGREESVRKKNLAFIDSLKEVQIYNHLTFSLKELTTEVMQDGRRKNQLLVIEALHALSSNSISIINKKTLVNSSMQWFAFPGSQDGETVDLYVNSLLFLYAYQNPLSFDRRKLMSMSRRDFRAGLLIEECRTASGGYARFIKDGAVKESLRPTPGKGEKLEYREIETAFKNAHKKGYPLYKKTVMKYRENAGDITWQMQD